MAVYDKLLNNTVAHIAQAHTGAQTRQLRMGGARDFVLPEASETPRGADDFELVAWLVIMDGQQAASGQGG